jgi:hypothetical protein
MYSAEAIAGISSAGAALDITSSKPAGAILRAISAVSAWEGGTTTILGAMCCPVLEFRR